MLKSHCKISSMDGPDCSEDTPMVSIKSPLVGDLRISRLAFLRVLVFLCLTVTAALCGSFAFVLLKQADERNFQSHFQMASNEAHDAIANSLDRVTSSAEAIADFVAVMFPLASAWPNASIYGYDHISRRFRNITKITATHLPIVYPNTSRSFEAYAQKLFGRSAVITSVSPTGEIYHDTTGQTYFSERNILTPILNCGHEVNCDGWRLLNVHSVPPLGVAVDRVLDCTDGGHKQCSVMTDILLSPDGTLASIVVVPVFPFEDICEVVGLEGISFDWETVIMGLIPDNINDMDVVITTETQEYTFTLGHGRLTLRGNGDLHDRQYSHMRRDITISAVRSMAVSAANYRVSVYPTDRLRASFLTDLPLKVSFVSVGIVLLTSVVFFTYDYYVHKESTAKKQILRAKRAFVRLVSHEIRTPLNTVTMGLKLLEEKIKTIEVTTLDSIKEEVEVSKDHQSHLLNITGEIMENTEVAVTVLNDLLQYDKITMGKMKVEFKPLRIDVLIQKAIQHFYIRAEQAGIGLTVSCEDLCDDNSRKYLTLGQVRVFGDRVRLAQVVSNIVSNALKFTPCGGYVNVTVRLNQHSDLPLPVQVKEVVGGKATGSVIMSVKDSGPGISKENLQLLFGEGVQFNPNELQGGQGSGLGLWISKSIVELHHGKIWAVSAGSGTGSTFNVELPVHDMCDTMAPHMSMQTPEVTILDSGPSPHHAPPPETTLSDMAQKVLVVDDAKSNRKFLCHLLRRRGYICDEAVDGMECLNIMRSPTAKEYSCILMDFQMPNMNGPEATAAIRRLGFSNLKIIGVTGNVMADDIDIFIRSGADMVLPKPLDIRLFEDVIPKVNGIGKESRNNQTGDENV